LEAYYADAIPVELVKADQKRIEAELKTLDRQIISSIEDHEHVVANLKAALEFAGNLAGAYCHASDDVRRQMNQVLFKKIYVDKRGICGLELKELFSLLLHPWSSMRRMRIAHTMSKYRNRSIARLVLTSCSEILSSLWKMNSQAQGWGTNKPPSL